MCYDILESINRVHKRELVSQKVKVKSLRNTAASPGAVLSSDKRAMSPRASTTNNNNLDSYIQRVKNFKYDHAKNHHQALHESVILRERTPMELITGINFFTKQKTLPKIEQKKTDNMY